jgi:hypothetical protein
VVCIVLGVGALSFPDAVDGAAEFDPDVVGLVDLGLVVACPVDRLGGVVLVRGTRRPGVAG